MESYRTYKVWFRGEDGWELDAVDTSYRNALISYQKLKDVYVNVKITTDMECVIPSNVDQLLKREEPKGIRFS